MTVIPSPKNKVYLDNFKKISCAQNTRTRVMRSSYASQRCLPRSSVCNRKRKSTALTPFNHVCLSFCLAISVSSGCKVFKCWRTPTGFHILDLLGSKQTRIRIRNTQQVLIKINKKSSMQGHESFRTEILFSYPFNAERLIKTSRSEPFKN
jgi:hypothetical protein